MNDSILDTPVDIKTVRRLHQDGCLTDEAFHAALKVVRPPSVWFAWADDDCGQAHTASIKMAFACVIINQQFADRLGHTVSGLGEQLCRV